MAASKDLAYAKMAREMAIIMLSSMQQVLQGRLAATKARQINRCQTRKKLSNYEKCYDKAIQVHVTITVLSHISASDPSNIN